MPEVMVRSSLLSGRRNPRGARGHNSVCEADLVQGRNWAG